MVDCIQFTFAEEFQRLRFLIESSCTQKVCYVDTYNDLPTTGNGVGEIRCVKDRVGNDESGLYIWDHVHEIWLPFCGPWGFPVDIRPSDRVPIDNDSFTTIVSYTIPTGKTFRLYHISVNVLGFSSEFRVEYYDGAATALIRSYIINTQETMESEDPKAPIELASGPGAYVRVVAKTLGVNQSGTAFANLNGTLI